MPARTPQECDNLFEQRINAGDLEGLVALYERQATFVPQEGEPVTGTDAIRQALSGFVAMKPKLKMGVTKVITAGADLAVLYNDWSMSATGPDGSAIKTTGKAVEVMRRQADGTWLFVVDAPFARG